MIRTFEGSGEGAGLSVGIAVASWNQSITDRLLEGALGRLDALGVDEVTVVRVPGALELPVAAKSLIERGADAVIAIGTVVKGDTDHYDIVVRESAAGIALLASRNRDPRGQRHPRRTRPRACRGAGGTRRCEQRSGGGRGRGPNRHRPERSE